MAGWVAAGTVPEIANWFAAAPRRRCRLGERRFPALHLLDLRP